MHRRSLGPTTKVEKSAAPARPFVAFRIFGRDSENARPDADASVTRALKEEKCWLVRRPVGQIYWNDDKPPPAGYYDRMFGY